MDLYGSKSKIPITLAFHLLPVFTQKHFKNENAFVMKLMQESSKIDLEGLLFSYREVDRMATRQIIIDVPEKILLAEKTNEADFAREMRILAAVKLYELGRLSSGRAAELAGMSRVEFLLILESYKVFPFESELRDLESNYA
jgi:predicted HTH domain antitoxin